MVCLLKDIQVLLKVRRTLRSVGTSSSNKGAVINWLQREYGEHVEVAYTLYEEYFAARNEGRHCYPTHRASLSDLILLNPVIKRIVHDNAWYLPENPEFDYKCLINIRGSTLCFQITGVHHEFQGRRFFNQFTLWGEGGRCCWGSQWRWPGQGC